MDAAARNGRQAPNRTRSWALKAAPVPVEGICVRVSAMRCHSQALTIKLKRDIPLADIEAIIAAGNSWVKVVPNRARALDPVPRARSRQQARSTFPSDACARWRWAGEYLSAFTVGDQLLWGAAEPLRRTMRFLLRSA